MITSTVVQAMIFWRQVLVLIGWMADRVTTPINFPGVKALVASRIMITTQGVVTSLNFQKIFCPKILSLSWFVVNSKLRSRMMISELLSRIFSKKVGDGVA